MIAYLQGTIKHLYNDFCYIDVQGVGYRVFIPNSTRQRLVINNNAILYTYLNVREDAMLLYGFYSQEEYDLFQNLIAITGIGPKVALGVLSAVNPDDFRLAVSQQNAVLLTRIPGIGKKTAERMILELKDKIGVPGLAAATLKETGASVVAAGDAVTEALQGLIALGYSQAEIMPALNKINAPDKSSADLIKLVLKEFAGRQ